MRTGEAQRVLDLLEVYWPQQWSPRNTRAWKEVVMDELDTMLADYSLDEVLQTVRDMGRSFERTPSYKNILDELRRTSGPVTMDGIGYRWEQYVYRVVYDGEGREYVRSCTVKVYDDGTFSLPKGIPWNGRELRRQGFLKGERPKEDPEQVQQVMEDVFKDW